MTTLLRLPAWLLSLPIRFYRCCISPFTPRSCRFDPSCSEYALEALRIHGALRGSWFTLRRMLRCHPFGGCGYDPVPARRSRQKGKTDEDLPKSR
ncbi:MAG: membrane protein insertion efficiency factor YidD [Planctomycetota bacterium]|nr:MAG: membrane protein insertion efficiency factor YidD [Planctomycetota bacterium]